MNKERILNITENITIAIAATSIAYFGYILLFCFSYYVHEFGHVLFGLIDNVFHGKLTIPKTHFISCSIFPVPQQTININDSVLFAFGGPIFSIIFFLGIAAFFSKLFRRYSAFFYLIAFTFIIREILGNIIFGTDNLKHGTLISANTLPLLSFVSENILILNVLFISIILIAIIKEKFPRKRAMPIRKI